MSETPATGPIGAPKDDAKPLDADELEFARRTTKLWERRLFATVDARDAEIARLQCELARLGPSKSVYEMIMERAKKP